MVFRSSLAAAFAATLLLPAAAVAAPSLRVEAPEVVRAGDVIALELTSTGGAPRAFQAAARFDHRLAERNGFRFRAGARGVQALGPVRRGATESFGAYALNAAPAGLGTLELLAVRPGVLRIGLSGVKTVGRDGRAATAGRTTLTVRIARRSARVPRVVQRATLRLGAVRTRPGTAGVRRYDATGDAVLDRADAAELALGWGRAREAGGAPCGARDVTGDGCLDVADVQRVADRTGGRRSAKPRRGRAAQAAPIVVTSTGDGDDAAADGECRAADGSCTLRAAITEANRQAGANTIAFDIPGAGARTIRLGSALPTLNDTSGPTTIDGYTQPGSSPNTAAAGSNAVLQVQVAGTGYGGSFDGFAITSPDNVVRGIALFDIRRPFTLSGSGAQRNALVGNFIGTDAAATAGAAAHNLYATGVVIERGAASNQVGGTAAADRNVISGNARHGVATYGIGTNRNAITGNVIGLAPGGDRRLQNMKHGIDLNEGSSFNVVERNVISGNGFENLDDFTAGVEVSHMAETTGNRIVGNRFGTDLAGGSAPAYAFNSHYGIRIEDQVNDVTVADNVLVNNRRGAIKVDAPGTTNVRISGNRIGVLPGGAPAANGNFGVLIAWRATRVTVGPDNVIAHNPVGVLVGHPDSDRNTITRNSMYANTGLGIDLEPWNGVSYNDIGDGDTGTNDGLNYPYVYKASTSAASGLACAGCTVEVFRADGAPGAYGEGKDFLAATTADGSGRFAVELTGMSQRDVVTATATDALGNTSEFSENVAVGDGTSPTSAITCDGGPCGGGWSATPVRVALSATDAGGSGVASIRYTVDGTDPTADSPAYDAPFTVERTTTVKYRAYDAAGNAEDVKSQLIRIDGAAPVSTITCDGGRCGTHSGAVQVALAATDADGSGVDAIRYTTDGTDPTASSPAYTAPFTVGQTTTVRFRAFDVAGNAEPVQSKEIVISAPAYFVRDDFERSVASGLGTADTGGAWSVNSATRTSVSGGEAVLSNWTGPNQDAHAWTSTVRTDMEILAQVRLHASNPVGGSYQPRVVARAQSDARNGYAARLSHTPSGGLSWGLSRIANAGGTGSLALGSGSLMPSGAAGTTWWIRLRVQGTSVQARFWQDGTAEPATWRASVTDAYYASGRASLGALVNAGVASPFPRVGFPSFSALDLAPA